MVEHSDILDNVFRAMADPTRRAMVRRLAHGEQSVTELAKPFEMSLAAASKHVKVLETAGLVSRTIHGRRHVCSLNREPLSEARQWLQHYEAFWNERLDALERVLSEPFPEAREDIADEPT